MGRFWDAFGHPPPSEIATLGDEVLIGVGKLVNDSAAPTETVLLGIGKVISDSAAPTEEVIVTNV